jgi:hypothetical protein
MSFLPVTDLQLTIFKRSIVARLRTDLGVSNNSDKQSSEVTSLKE